MQGDRSVPPAEMRGVTKRYGGETAVGDLTLTLNPGEFVSLVGPSGCGKTTTLRLLGGFTVPDEGEILLDGQDVTDIPPYRRNVNTVFQSFALFDHLSVWENVAFGLKRRKVEKGEIVRRVGEALELVQLTARADAKPAELSGGQQQRVALARAIINRPALLLLDEPLGALDLKLRRQMQVELKALQRELGITFLFVTHDQEEALSMSDRIGVMNSGRLQQLGMAAEIYETPANTFVAGFVGTCNLMPAVMRGDALSVAGIVDVPLNPTQRAGYSQNERVSVSVRPEKLEVGPTTKDGTVRVSADVVDVVYLGASTNILLDLPGGVRLVALQVATPGSSRVSVQRGERTEVSWRPDDMLILHEDAECTGGMSELSVHY
jgi:spermidine/putrescine transport system ATP-binding protein